MRGNIDKRNTRKRFCMEEMALFSRGGGWRSHRAYTEVTEFYSDIALFETLF